MFERFVKVVGTAVSIYVLVLCSIMLWLLTTGVVQAQQAPEAPSPPLLPPGPRKIRKWKRPLGN